MEAMKVKTYLGKTPYHEIWGESLLLIENLRSEIINITRYEDEDYFTIQLRKGDNIDVHHHYYDEFIRSLGLARS